MNNNYNGIGQFVIDTDSDSIPESLIDDVLDILDPKMIFEEESDGLHCGLADGHHSEAKQDDHISIMDNQQQIEADKDENEENKANNDDIGNIGDEEYANHAFIDDISPAERHNDDNDIGDIGDIGHDEEEKLEYEEIRQNQQIERMIYLCTFSLYLSFSVLSEI